MSSNIVFVFFTFVLMFTSSCSSVKMEKMLLYHSSQLEQLAKREMAAPEKVDVMAALMVEALEESLQFAKTKHSVKFLREYTKQNQSSVNKIYKEVESWYNSLSTTERLVATARLATKPYVRQLYNLVPKVEKKINRKLKTIFFLSKFTNLLKLV
ncbi:hypothetical protein N9B82_01430 [Saprospiraceae bacterium]|nr:hypothetical protein [Saprospiraceae bacterium]